MIPVCCLIVLILLLPAALNFGMWAQNIAFMPDVDVKMFSDGDVVCFIASSAHYGWMLTRW